jgi:hypothetical protein
MYEVFCFFYDFLVEYFCHYLGGSMAVQFRVLKNGRPVEGVNIYYRKEGMFGGTGDRNTDDQGYATFQVNSGMAAIIRIHGKGISYETRDYYLKSGVNEFRF